MLLAIYSQNGQQLFRGLYSLVCVLLPFRLLEGIPEAGAADCPPVLVTLTRAGRRVAAVTRDMSRLTALEASVTSPSSSVTTGILRLLGAELRNVARLAALETCLVVGILTTALAAAAAIETTVPTTPTFFLWCFRPSLFSHIELEIKSRDWIK